MKLLKNSIAIFVILIIVLIIVPLPPFWLDVMFIINITLSLVILLTTMYINDALEFSIFPSMLLITTLFRLALNISSTRLILSGEGQAGKLIQTFGEFVIQGNVVIGCIIFLIIILVQFIVITKGAERVAEVGARFTLDAMPGKQMAIDADLNAGLINQEQAKARRRKVEREADFYGAMDGSTKFVKGDAIMSVIITVINFFGGLIIGMMQSGNSFGEVLNIYSIATIGDGLVSQIPALLISAATGMIITRSSSETNLNEDVGKQFMSQSTVLILAGGIMLCVCAIPGSPKPQLILISAFLMFLGYRIRQKPSSAPQVQNVMEETRQSIEEENDFYKTVDNVYSLIQTELIEVEFGYNLIPLVDESMGGSFIDKVVLFRKQFATEMGMVVPPVKLRDNGLLVPNAYTIKIKGEEVDSGEVLVDYLLALDTGDTRAEIDGIDAIEPTYRIPSKWITRDQKDLAVMYGYSVIEPISVMVNHLSGNIRRHTDELLTRSQVITLVENVKATSEQLVNEVVPGVISYASLQKILKNLLREGIPIKNMESILEIISDVGTSVKDTDILTEKIRQAFKRTISKQYSDNRQMRVLTLDAVVENSIVSNVKRTEGETYVVLPPELLNAVVTRMAALLDKNRRLMEVPVVLTSPIVRLYFARIIHQFFPEVVVLSFQEIDQDIQIQALGNIEAAG